VFLREPVQPDRFLTKEQVRRWADHAAGPQIEAAIWLLAYTGLRANELLAIEGRPATPALSVGDGKTGKRVVPVAPPARKYLARLPIGLTYWTLKERMDEARDDAGLPKWATPHKLRHTCASWLINAGVDLHTVARILGDTLQTAQRYAHLVTGTLERAVGRMK
jgi:integrase